MEPQAKKPRTDKTRPMTTQNSTINLLPAEKLLRELLLGCRAHMQNTGLAAASNLEMWITGGWVRDRLLGIPCSDVDIALSTMTGSQFGESLTEYFNLDEDRFTNRASEIGLQTSSVFTGFHTTKLNLRKSKNLETTIGKVFGLDVDLVNLRKEVYDDDSRTPVMEFGTAQEDAFRRDATVNSLFFNLDTQQVVDLTGRGLDDMAAGVIRTPLEPHKTFMDDPLRVLRLIRIGSKLGYSVEEKTERSMGDAEIHAALGVKVSRERVGIEVLKMMRQPNPQFALKSLFEADLYHTVFLERNSSLRKALQHELPTQEVERPWPMSWQRTYQLLARLLVDEESELGRMIRAEESVENLWLMAAFAPLAGLPQDMRSQAVAAFSESIKTTSKQTKLLEEAMQNMDSIRRTIALVNEKQDKPPTRSSIGMALRSWSWSWRPQVLCSLLTQVVYETSLPWSLPSADADATLGGFLAQYNTFLDFVTREGLHDVRAMKSLLGGKAIMDLFGLRKGGPFLGKALRRRGSGMAPWAEGSAGRSARQGMCAREGGLSMLRKQAGPCAPPRGRRVEL
ncbi:hypothetical protein XA68_18418 [Ophiocordyceps unilateralis]|uniref:Poly A polymerase head domain-containing protein n=1 Tax=Ophiocordyceps unilateralis TaxID=268505 RepID=A0A2A9PJE8_OPHUN|nr:hypothetical protein XA68_18418 [Ophiocordyceps unilateralis]